jgi:hypothetical protein
VNGTSNTQIQRTDVGIALDAFDGWARIDATDTVAKDFIGLRRRGLAAKTAAVTVATFHGVTEVRVLTAYEMWEHARQDYLS